VKPSRTAGKSALRREPAPGAEPLGRDRIVDATEEVLRRFGPDKATVVDVARALGVSHGSVYRHFRSKTELRDAVAARWLARVTEPLVEIVATEGPAVPRLWAWLRRLIATKRRKLRDDPELFATYGQLVSASRGVVKAHIDELTRQLADIIADGVKRGELAPVHPPTAARAIFIATGRFHDPAHAGSWSDPGVDASFNAVFELLVRGLRAPATSPKSRRPPPGRRRS